jgi:hypothetical protein
MRDQIKAYVDGELSGAEAQEMEAAMKTDADLQAEVEMMRFLGTQLSSARVRFEPKGMDKVAARFEKKRRWRMMPLAVAGMLAVGIIVWPMIRGDSGRVFAFSDLGNGVAGDVEGPGEVPKVSHSTEAGAAVPAPHVFLKTDGENIQGRGVNAGKAVPDPSLPLSEVDASSGPSDPPHFGGGVAFGAGNDPRKEARQTGLRGIDNDSKLAETFRDNPRVTDNPNISPVGPLLVRTGSITIRVKSAQDAMNEAIGIAKSMGGYHEASHHSAGKGYDAQADVTIRIPVTRFDRALSALRELGEVTDDSSEAQDVTAEIADVGARLKVMRAEEESYVTMLRAGRKVGEILEIKDRLSTVRQEIESLTAQQKALKNQSSYSTITCSFTQRPQAEAKAEPTNWIEDAWANGANGAKSLGRAIGTFCIFALSYAPFWLPVVLLGWFLSRRRAA